MPRTEQDVLKDFEKLDWNILDNTEDRLILQQQNKLPRNIWVRKDHNDYYDNTIITMQEHKLLNELFTIWRWL